MTTEAAVDTPGRFVDIDGAGIYYEEHGAGVPFVLLHGGLQASAAWTDVVPLLATRFRVITPDSRGHGRSSNPRAAGLTYRAIARDTVGLIAALGLERPIVGGWSDGGQVALEIGIRDPGAARALVVGGAFTEYGEEWRRSVREMFGVDATGKVDVGRFEAGLGERSARFRAMHSDAEDAWPRLLRRTAEMWLEYPGLSEGEIRRVEAPSLVIVGDRDHFVPARVAAAMCEMLPRGELAIRPGADHGLPTTHAAWFAQTVMDFLDRRVAASPREST